jgi:carboxymethylenebutenolidase
MSILARLIILAGAVVVGLAGAIHVFAQVEKPAVPPRPLTPFLEVFRATRTVPVITSTITIPTAVGKVSGYLARPAGQERLPAVLLLFGKSGTTAWMKKSTRELASVGYVALALEGKVPAAASPEKTQAVFVAPAVERILAEQSAAIRWLRRRPDVFPDRLGVAGWAAGGVQALTLAASTPLQACVICDSQPGADAATIAGLRWTPVLGVISGKKKDCLRALPAFRKALATAGIVHKIRVFEKVEPGFMEIPERSEADGDAAEEAWVDVYEFLGKYVEDAPENSPIAVTGKVLQPRLPFATIADVMRSINGPDGARFVLIQSLEKEPSTRPQWNRIRANAALIAESGRLLHDLTPRIGGQAHWRDMADAFTAAAEKIATAADTKDYAAARRGLSALATSCSRCHNRHR